MKSISQKLLLFIFLGFLCCCSPNKSPFFEEIIGSEKGNIRGVEISTSIENVKKLEDEKNLKDETSEYLNYDYTINMGNSYTVTYDFSEDDQLYEIEIAIYLDVINDAAILFKDFSDYFNKKYNTGKKEEDGYMTWYTNSTLSGNKVSISIINDSDSYGFITILIRDLDY